MARGWAMTPVGLGLDDIDETPHVDDRRLSNLQASHVRGEPRRWRWRVAAIAGGEAKRHTVSGLWIAPPATPASGTSTHLRVALMALLTYPQHRYVAGAEAKRGEP